MIVRPYRQQDESAVHKILTANAVPDEKQLHGAYPTWVLEEEEILGLFTLAEAVHGFPMLLHFNLKPECKDTGHARLLARAFRQVVRDMGYVKAIVHANTARMKKITEYYFRVKPYADVGEDAYYLVEV